MEKGTTWFNPTVGIIEFLKKLSLTKIELDLDDEKALNNRKMQTAKEIYTTAVVAKFFEAFDKKDFWIIKPLQDPPDGVMGTLQIENNVQNMSVREIEVVEHINGA